MSLYRIKNKEVNAVFGCGHDVAIKIKDLRAVPRGVLFPPCPVCGKALLQVMCVIRPEAIEVRDEVRQRDVLIHSLHKICADAGQLADGFKKADLSEDSHPLAMEVPIVGLEAPVNKGFDSLRRQKIAEEGGDVPPVDPPEDPIPEGEALSEVKADQGKKAKRESEKKAAAKKDKEAWENSGKEE